MVNCLGLLRLISIAYKLLFIYFFFIFLALYKPQQCGPGLMLIFVHFKKDLYFQPLCSLESSRLANT